MPSHDASPVQRLRDLADELADHSGIVRPSARGLTGPTGMALAHIYDGLLALAADLDPCQLCDEEADDWPICTACQDALQLPRCRRCLSPGADPCRDCYEAEREDHADHVRADRDEPRGY